MMMNTNSCLVPNWASTIDIMVNNHMLKSIELLKKGTLNTIDKPQTTLLSVLSSMNVEDKTIYNLA